MITKPICIIDDDEDIRGVLAFALEYENIPSVTFESANEAEKYLSKLEPENFPCLLVIDYMMPGMTGVEFISLIESKYPETLAKIPMALSTGFFSDDIERLPSKIIKLEKPIDLQDFIKLVKEHYSAPEKPYPLV